MELAKIHDVHAQFAMSIVRVLDVVEVSIKNDDIEGALEYVRKARRLFFGMAISDQKLSTLSEVIENLQT